MFFGKNQVEPGVGVVQIDFGANSAKKLTTKHRRMIMEVRNLEKN